LSSAFRTRSDPREVLTVLKINQLSTVDRPAMEGATSLLLKRHGSSDPDASGVLWKNGTPGVLTSETDGHTHIVWLHGMVGESTMQRAEGDEGHHDHPWTLNADGSITIGANNGHDHNVPAEAAIAALVAMNKLHQAGEGETPDGSPGAGQTTTTQETDMPELTDVQKLEERVAKAEARAEAAETRSQLESILGSLTDVHKAHFDGLADEGKIAFAKMDVAQRDASLDAIETARKAADPVAYTCDDGTEIHKSAGDHLVRLAKRADEADRRAEKLEGEATVSRLEKRAGEELGNLPGTTEEKVAMLKALETIPEGPAREAARKAMVAGNDAISAAYNRQGTVTPSPEGTPLGDLDSISKAYAKEHNVTDAVAMSKVLATPEGKAMYASHRRVNPAIPSQNN
jgi:hypothetical protein